MGSVGYWHSYTCFHLRRADRLIPCIRKSRINQGDRAEYRVYPAGFQRWRRHPDHQHPPPCRRTSTAITWFTNATLGRSWTYQWQFGRARTFDIALPRHARCLGTAKPCSPVRNACLVRRASRRLYALSCHSRSGSWTCPPILNANPVVLGHAAPPLSGNKSGSRNEKGAATWQIPPPWR